MIYCPKCGTANLDASRFCNECGEELAIQTQVECPRCGAQNPIQNVLCSACNGRLPTYAPSPPDAGATPTIKGLSLPTKTSTGEQVAEADDVAEPTLEDDAPAWLRELGASLSADAEVDDADLADDAEVPDWLRDLRASLPKESEGEVQAEGESLPDWLVAPRTAPAGAEDRPAFDRHEPESESRPPESETLAAGTESEDAPPVDEPRDEEIPGWLSRLVPAAAAPGSEIQAPGHGEEEVPGWLSRLVPGEAGAETEPAPAAPQSEEGEASGAMVELPQEEYEAGAAGEPLDQGEEGELPDWMAKPPHAEDEAGAAAEPPDQVEEGELPDWMVEPPQAEDEAGAAAEPPEQGEEGELPGWMAELQQVEDEAGPEAELPSAIEEGELPDWMAELQQVEDEVGPEADLPGAIEEGELPDWMAEMQQVEDEAGAEAELPGAIEEGEIPDWLAALRPAEEEVETGPLDSEFDWDESLDRIAALEPPSEELPLAEELGSPDEAESETPEEGTPFRLPPEVEAALGPAVPAWLAELQIEAPEAAAAIIEETAVDGELPDWLLQAEVEPDESLAPAEIPGWLLALKPSELREEGAELPSPQVREWSEESGLLAGIPGTLPVEMLIAQPRAIAITEPLDLTIEDSPSAQLFSEIVGTAPEAAPKELVTPKADLLPKVARWILYAILILVVAVPIIIGEPISQRTIEPTAAVVEMHSAIESLDSLAPVLVAFDYDPASSGEMDPIARALIGHLMDRGVRLVVVSLLPAGPATAQSLLDELAEAHPSYAHAEGYGESYVNLGYLPGQAAAVRLLCLSVGDALRRDFYGKPLSDLPVMEGLDSAQDFALIVELAAAQDTLRWWIEQAGAPFPVQVGAGASASVMPFARPYYETESGQLVGLVGSVPDAVAYEVLASGQSTPAGPSAARLDSQSGAQVLLILVILAGNVAYFWPRGTRREL